MKRGERFEFSCPTLEYTENITTCCEKTKKASSLPTEKKPWQESSLLGASVVECPNVKISYFGRNRRRTGKTIAYTKFSNRIK